MKTDEELAAFLEARAMQCIVESGYFVAYVAPITFHWRVESKEGRMRRA
jgi:hypothetical protein